jgi:diguanylate cyclase (GGDEF)-like protein
VVNAEASLDLGELARATNPQLRSCLAAPLLVGTDLVGVLTLYSDIPLAFSEDHRRLIEMIGSRVSRKVSQAIEVDKFRAAALCDSVTGLPNLKRLNQLVAPPDSLLALAGQPIALILLDVVNLKGLNRRFRLQFGDSVLSHVSNVIRSALRAGDILFRSENDEFLVLLTQTDIFTAQVIADRIVAQAADEPYVAPDGAKLKLALESGVAAERTGKRTLDELIVSARSRMFNQPRLPGDRLSTVH